VRVSCSTPQRLPLATLARDGQVLTAQGFAAGPDGVQRVALGAVTAPRALGPVDLNNPLAMGAQDAREPSAIAAGPLQRPAAAARRAFGDQAEQPRITGLVGWDPQLSDQPAVAVQDRGGMLVAVGVDPDDVVDLAF
jgi:hypothetical protein